MNSTFHPDNIRVGSTLSSGFNLYNDINYQIPWLMSPQKDYTPFWLEGHSNELDMVSSIYGCQGFESDYVGIIWGRDFVWRNDQWIIGNSDIITDNIDGLNSCVRNNPELAIKLLQNRYRIFLTRGMLGTVIYCEDEETIQANTKETIQLAKQYKQTQKQHQSKKQLLNNEITTITKLSKIRHHIHFK